MTTRRKASFAAAEPAASSTPDVGEAPGSLAYFGESLDAGYSPDDDTPDFEVADTGIGKPGSAEYWGADSAPHAASLGPDGDVLLPTVGEPPGSPSYFGAGGGTAEPAASSTQQDVGEAPGSPAYFGESAGAGSSGADADPEYELVPDTGPGASPGSAEYWGLDAATPNASRGPDGEASPLATDGEPPGGASYFGTDEGVK